MGIGKSATPPNVRTVSTDNLLFCIVQETSRCNLICQTEFSIKLCNFHLLSQNLFIMDIHFGFIWLPAKLTQFSAAKRLCGSHY